MESIIRLSVIFFLAIQFSGCMTPPVVRTSIVHKPRIDQEISGNRGFIFGRPTTAVREPMFKDRKIHCVEIELPVVTKDTGKAAPAVKSTAAQLKQAQVKEGIPQSGIKSSAETLTYKVQEGDTLQKISQKFYGTTKKWKLLYSYNEETLKSADTVYPGQVLVIPGEIKYEK